MDRYEFWSHVARARQRSSTEPEVGLREELESLSLADLGNFQRIFDQLFDAAYRWDLWGAAYLIDGGCSDDGFTDFRYGLISLGQAVFEAALDRPDSLVLIDEFIPNELYGYVATKLIKSRGETLDASRYAPHPSRPSGEAWDFDDPVELGRRLPELWARYGR